MITDPVLNSEPFNSLFPFNEKAYDSFYKLKDIDIFVDLIDSMKLLYFPLLYHFH